MFGGSSHQPSCRRPCHRKRPGRRPTCPLVSLPHPSPPREQVTGYRLQAARKRLFLVAKLQVVDLTVEAIARQELVVPAALDDLSVLEDQDLVRVLHGSQALCDDEGCPTLH